MGRQVKSGEQTNEGALDRKYFERLTLNGQQLTFTPVNHDQIIYHSNFQLNCAVQLEPVEEFSSF